MSNQVLLLDKRFWPAFWTQFFGAFNDNVYKQSLILLITYQSFQVAGLGVNSMAALCGGIFILPFFLFSAMAGQICDKYSKSQLMFFIKVWEIIVMVVGAIGFLTQNIYLLLGTLFLMGLQSTFFGPVKYSILPELLEDHELVEGNALVEMGTFVAILLGTIGAGILIAIKENGITYVAISVIAFAFIGTLTSKKVIKIQPGDNDLKIDWNIFKSTWDIMGITKKKESVFLAVLGISWFWFLGAAVMSMFPGYVKGYLDGDERVATFLLAIFSVGVALGSIICEKLSRERIELGLVPFGTIGMSVFLLDIFIGGTPVVSMANLADEKFLSVMEFLSDTKNYRVIVDFFGLAVFSGFFTVPLYTFIQAESDENERSRVIAGLNILNALFMVGSAVLLMIFYALGFSMPQIFAVWSLFNLAVSVYIYGVLPEFMLRFWAMVLSRISYRVKVDGHDHIPAEGACILTCNHVSFADWLILAAAIKRPVRFIMYYKFMKIPVIKYLFRDAKVIPIAGKKEDEAILNQAMEEISRGLEAGDIICIFPEGEITRDGNLGPFKPGIEKILEKNPVPVIPMTLHGLWGSFFSRKYNGKALSKPSLLIKTFLRRVDLKVHAVWQAEDVTAKKLEDFTAERL